MSHPEFWFSPKFGMTHFIYQDQLFFMWNQQAGSSDQGIIGLQVVQLCQFYSINSVVVANRVHRISNFYHMLGKVGILVVVIIATIRTVILPWARNIGRFCFWARGVGVVPLRFVVLVIGRFRREIRFIRLRRIIFVVVHGRFYRFLWRFVVAGRCR